MKDFVFADAIARELQRDGFAVQPTASPEEIVPYCRIASPYALLMEVTGCPLYRLDERMQVRDRVLRETPSCKIVLLVDENSEAALAGQVKQVKKDGQIDQFIYGSLSAAYLTALMDTL